MPESLTKVTREPICKHLVQRRFRVGAVTVLRTGHVHPLTANELTGRCASALFEVTKELLAMGGNLGRIEHLLSSTASIRCYIHQVEERSQSFFGVLEAAYNILSTMTRR
jgi:hypothetical protein